MSVCQQCKVENELDQWYEAPKLRHLICPRCAVEISYARPITVGQLTERILELREQLDAMRKDNQDMLELATDSPDISKQLRRLVREAERMRQANEQTAKTLAELVENLSPRWVLEVDNSEAAKRVMEKLATEANPGAILRLSPEEMDVLRSMHRI